jgi:hypothetical protein
MLIDGVDLPPVCGVVKRCRLGLVEPITQVPAEPQN